MAPMVELARASRRPRVVPFGDSQVRRTPSLRKPFRPSGLQAAGVGHFGGPLQNALNGAKKAEQKVMKLYQARAAADDQRQSYNARELHQGGDEVPTECREDPAGSEGGRAATGVTHAAKEAAAWDAEAAPDWAGVLNPAMDAWA